jgi:protein translocase subunit secY/sec61 alpha
MMAALLLTTGTMTLMWIGEQIEEHGIGSGISIVIMVGIIERLPWAFSQVMQSFTFSVTPAEHQIGIVKLIVLLGMFFAIVGGVVYITQGQRRIPVQQAKHTRGRKVYGGQRHFFTAPCESGRGHAYHIRTVASYFSSSHYAGNSSKI